MGGVRILTAYGYRVSIRLILARTTRLGDRNALVCERIVTRRSAAAVCCLVQQHSSAQPPRALWHTGLACLPTADYDRLHDSDLARRGVHGSRSAGPQRRIDRWRVLHLQLDHPDLD